MFAHAHRLDHNQETYAKKLTTYEYLSPYRIRVLSASPLASTFLEEQAGRSVRPTLRALN